MTLNFITRSKSNANLEFVIDGQVTVNTANLNFSSKSYSANLEFVVEDGVVDLRYLLTGASKSPKTVSTAQVLISYIVGGSAEASGKSTGSSKVLYRFDGSSVCHDCNSVSIGEVLYDVNVDRNPKGASGSVFSNGRTQYDTFGSQFDVAYLLKVFPRTNWNAGIATYDELSPDWVMLDKHTDESSSHWLDGLVSNDDLTVDWYNLDSAHDHTSVDWVDGEAVLNEFTTSFINPAKHVDHVKSTWGDSSERVVISLASSFIKADITTKRFTSLWNDAVNPWGIRKPDPIEPPKPDPTDPDLNFRQLKYTDSHLEFLYIELEALIVMNEVSVVHIAGDGTRTNIHPVGLGLSLDLESYCWTLSGELLGKEALVYLNAQDVHEVTINGWKWNFTVNGFDRNRSVGTVSYKYDADSSVRLLGEGYSAKTSSTNDTIISAWQLAEQKLADKSFTVDRAGMLDWTLAADSYSYSQLTPIELLNAVAVAAGAILNPDMTDDVVHVQPRYKTSPWLWDAMEDHECDHLIPESFIITESMKDESTDQIERVLVTGKNEGSVSTNVKRTGTAGLVVGTQVVSDLQQDHAVNTEKARNVFAESGEQTVTGWRVPLLTPTEAFGLIVPGQIVRVKNEDGTATTGLCLSTSIAVGNLVDIWQDVSVELHYYG